MIEGSARGCKGLAEVLRGLLQDAIKKGNNEELPDFYNIVLERPRDDPAGYDVLFVDAASKVPLAHQGTGTLAFLMRFAMFHENPVLPMSSFLVEGCVVSDCSV